MKKTFAEQISAFEATRAAKVAEMDNVMNDVAEKGLTLDTEQKEKYDGLENEVTEIDEHLVRLRASERRNKEQARSIDGATQRAAADIAWLAGHRGATGDAEGGWIYPAVRRPLPGQAKRRSSGRNRAVEGMGRGHRKRAADADGRCGTRRGGGGHHDRRDMGCAAGDAAEPDRRVHRTALRGIGAQPHSGADAGAVQHQGATRDNRSDGQLGRRGQAQAGQCDGIRQRDAELQ